MIWSCRLCRRRRMWRVRRSRRSATLSTRAWTPRWISGNLFSCLMAQPLFYWLTLSSGDGDGAGVARIEGAHRGRQGHLQEVPAQNVVRALPEVSLRTLWIGDLNHMITFVIFGPCDISYMCSFSPDCKGMHELPQFGMIIYASLLSCWWWGYGCILICPDKVL